MDYIKRGTVNFRNANLALFAGAFSTFANLYMTQPLLPTFTEVFHISPTVASLSLSVTTLTLAFSMLIIGSLSEAWGRKKIMAFSMFAGAILTLFIALAPNYSILLTLRIVQGIVFAGLPAIAMAYLGEEVEPKSLGIAMGLYISGNTIGGLGGRIIVGTMTDLFSWRIGMIAIGVISFIVSFAFYFLLPSSKHFEAKKLNVKGLLHSMILHLKDPALLSLFGLGFLLMGSFVTLYNYIGFQLVAPPFSLSQTIVGWIFIIYLVGTFSSTWFGSLSDRFGKYKMLVIAIVIMFIGGIITLENHLLLKIAGIAIFTFGFFGGHSIASSWVGRRATHDKAQASSLYLFFYYVGSSVGGTVGGIFWTVYGWHGVIGMIISFLLASFILAFYLRKTLHEQAL
ncbi:MFS transporter [Viridibacillus sp. FSL R5-0477]|uniref:Transport protein n=1 Tax=Viridibacillus arenosi FSL R5-213 TaxID=1227360 RepID=W4ESA4_9BACL|nr:MULTISPECIES: MFS transporter [Viridibacillus]ETT82912.1 transport protein [Viridibacillus arenosi FSL R5-213]OMC82141.1 MFS transporter [Viridibacillus sp. FSL H8-0123]OMC86298.1 MFS transporter [Viridibacillus sp. FSL H7-0596]OMC90798.1 MFS transporter [Viridibacillus arenosi]